MKKNRQNILVIIAVVSTLLLALFAMGKIWNDERVFVKDERDVEKVKIIGEYSVNGEDYRPIPENGALGLSGHNNVTIRGNLNKDVPANKLVILRLDNLKAKVFQNGKEIFNFGAEGSFPEYAKSPGNLWDYFISPGISIADDITIELYNVYTDHVETTYTRFLNNMYIGYGDGLISYNIRRGLANGFVAIFVICMGVIASGLAVIMFRMGQGVKNLIYFIGLSISSGIWFFIDFEIQQYFSPYPVLNNSLDIVSLLFSTFFLLCYFSAYLKSKCKLILQVLAGTLLGIIVIATVTQLLGIADYYDYLFFIQLLSIIFAPIIAGTFLYEYRKYKSYDMKRILISTMILCIGIMGDALCNMLEITPFLMWIKIGYVIFMLIHFMRISQMIRNLMAESARLQVLEELAYQDALTGIKNRTAYFEKIDQINKKLEQGYKLGVVVLDVNNLKIVNDTLGHEHGDRYILDGCEILYKIFDKKHIYRIGGDEFVVILESITKEKCIELGEKLEEEMRKSEQYYIGKIKVSLAYGIAMYSYGVDTCYEDVFVRADSSMYKKKVQMKQKAVN